MNKMLVYGCDICKHIDDHPQMACIHCTMAHECFELDLGKLQEAVDIGIITKRRAKVIQEDYEDHQEIPGQLRLPIGGDYL